MKNCRDCQTQVSEQAIMCPKCGAPYPAKAKWDGWGWEYKSPTVIMGLPLLHIAFKYRPNKRPVVAHGVIAIGQFATGIVTIAQFGIGVFSLSQFTLAGFAVAQIAVAYSCIAQIGFYIDYGWGQIVKNIADII